MTRSAPFTASAGFSYAASTMPSSFATRRVSAVRAAQTISAARLCRRTPRALEEPIRLMPISASRLNLTSAILSLFAEKFSQRLYYRIVFVIKTNAHAQARWKAIARNRAQQQALGREIAFRLGGRLSRSLEIDQQEIANAWRDAKAHTAKCLRQDRQPFVIMPPRGLDMLLIANSFDPAGLGERVDVKGSAHPVQHIGNRRRAIGPAETERGEAIDF